MTPGGNSVAVSAEPSAPIAPLLPYADIELPDHITEVGTVSVRPDVRAVHVPPIQGWQSLRLRLLVTTALSTMSAATLLGSVVFGRIRFVEAAGMLVDLGIVALVAFCFCLHRLHRRLGFQVTPYDFAMTSAGPFGVSRRKWARAIVLDVHMNRANQKLVVRLHKAPSIETFISDDRAVTQSVINELTAALEAIPAAPAGHQLLPVDPASGLPPSRARTVLHRTGMTVAVLAVAAAPFTGGFSLWLLVAAGMLIGIALGSQKKEFWA